MDDDTTMRLQSLDRRIRAVASRVTRLEERVSTVEDRTAAMQVADEIAREVWKKLRRLFFYGLAALGGVATLAVSIEQLLPHK